MRISNKLFWKTSKTDHFYVLAVQMSKFSFSHIYTHPLLFLLPPLHSYSISLISGYISHHKSETQATIVWQYLVPHFTLRNLYLVTWCPRSSLIHPHLLIFIFEIKDAFLMLFLRWWLLLSSKLPKENVFLLQEGK